MGSGFLCYAYLTILYLLSILCYVYFTTVINKKVPKLIGGGPHKSGGGGGKIFQN